MRRALLPALPIAALALSIAPAAAPAQGSDFTIVSFDTAPNGGRILDSRMVPVRIAGDVETTFHGDAGAGCRAVDACALQGSELWQPGSSADLLLVRERRGQRAMTSAALFLGADSTGQGGTVTEQTRRLRAGGGVATCADEQSVLLQQLEVEVRGPRVPLGLGPAGGAGLAVVGTRCAGPLESDVAPALTVRRIAYGRLARGGLTIDLRSRRAFRGHGFAGTVRSTLVLRLARGRRTPSAGSGGAPPAGGHGPRIRAITVFYRVARVTGRLSVAAYGMGGACRLLDACRASEDITLAPRATGGEAALLGQQPANAPRRRLRAALGLAPGRSSRAIAATGGATWNDTGTVTAALTRAHGDGECRDEAPLDGGDLGLTVVGRSLRATYGYADALPSFDPLRTRCPGPFVGDIVGDGTLAAGRIPAAALHRRRLVIHLHGIARSPADPWAAAVTGNVTVVLVREHVIEQTFRD